MLENLRNVQVELDVYPESFIYFIIFLLPFEAAKGKGTKYDDAAVFGEENHLA